MQVNDTISINLDAVLTSNGSMLSAWTGGKIVAITAKAVKLMGTTENGKEITCWFPIKALNFFGNPSTNPFDESILYCAKLAHWFKLDNWASTYVNLTRDNRTLCA